MLWFVPMEDITNNSLFISRRLFHNQYFQITVKIYSYSSPSAAWIVVVLGLPFLWREGVMGGTATKQTSQHNTLISFLFFINLSSSLLFNYSLFFFEFVFIY